MRFQVAEVKVAMKKKLKREVSDADARNLITAIDTDGSGNVSAEEFKRAIESDSSDKLLDLVK